jgi:hypothetical protein
MIQRIQSLFLFIGAVLLSLDLYLPTWKWTSNSKINSISVDAFNITYQWGKSISGRSFPYIGIGLIVTILLSLFIILQFKNRTLQMRLCLLNALLIFVVTGLMYWGSKEAQQFTILPSPGDFTIAFFFPSLAVLLNLLAMRSIKKDEELVRSADRIR